jgi:hypothetical protein
MEACLSSGQCIITFQLVASDQSTSVQAFFAGAINGCDTFALVQQLVMVQNHLNELKLKRV